MTATGRLRTREKLASLKTENTSLKSKLKAAEIEIAGLKRYKMITFATRPILTMGLVIFVSLFFGMEKCDKEMQPLDSQIKPSISRELNIIPREQWASKDLKRNITDPDFVQLRLPVEKGVIAHHTSVPENRCFTYGEFENHNEFQI